MKKITYLEHSGFFLEFDQCCLLFDYWKGEIPKCEKPLYVFVSHAHQDHYNPDIFKLQDTWEKITYILSDDIKIEKKDNVWFVQGQQSYQIEDLKIETLTSTDEGVAFLVEVAGIRVFHSGDYHWWHWEEESTQDEKKQAKEDFLRQLPRLQGAPIDIAFLVLDPRLDEQTAWGLRAFLETLDINYVFPMHVWGDYHVIQRFKQKEQDCIKTTKIMDLHHPQEEFTL